MASLKAGEEGRDPYRYRSLVLFASSCEGETWLRRALLNSFVRLHDSARDEGRNPKPVLYWRYASAERIQMEQCGTGAQECGLRKISTRVAIPTADWSVLTSIVPVVER